MGLTELATKAELEPSLVSRLLAESETNRRDPRIEHVYAFARALAIAPIQLVAGTPAEALLDEWVPREAMAAEVESRILAQNEAAALRADLAGCQRELRIRDQQLEAARSTYARLEQKNRELEAENGRLEEFARVSHEEAQQALAKAARSDKEAASAKARASAVVATAGFVGAVALAKKLSR